MIPCNQSLPVSAVLYVAGNMSHPGHAICNFIDILNHGSNATSFTAVYLEVSFNCNFELHKIYAGNLTLLGSENEYYAVILETFISEIRLLLYMYVCVFSFQFAIFLHILGTFTTINVNFTVLPSQICATCTFLDKATNIGCYGQITSKDVRFQAVFMINASSDLHTKCVLCHFSALYQLTVYDVDNNGAVSSFPAFIYHNISVLASGL